MPALTLVHKQPPDVGGNGPFFLLDAIVGGLRAHGIALELKQDDLTFMGAPQRLQCLVPARLYGNLCETVSSIYTILADRNCHYVRVHSAGRLIAGKILEHGMRWQPQLIDDAGMDGLRYCFNVLNFLFRNGGLLDEHGQINANGDAQEHLTTLDPAELGGEARALKQNLQKLVIGQPLAVDAIANTYQMYLAGLHAPGRPIGSFLFLGPTGTGKTRTVEAAAEALVNNSRAVIKIDCAEYQHGYEISKLTGPLQAMSDTVKRNSKIKRRPC